MKKNSHNRTKHFDPALIRLAVVAGVALLGILRLGAALHRIQVRDSGDYAREQIRHSIRRVRLPATRGRILDRNGVVLADNKPSFSVAIYIEDLRRPGSWTNTVNRVDVLIDTLARTINRPRDISRDDIWRHIQRRRAIPLLAFSGLSDVELARYEESYRRLIDGGDDSLIGTDIYAGVERVYPNGDLAAHIIGYVGKDNSKNDPTPESVSYAGVIDSADKPDRPEKPEKTAAEYSDLESIEDDALVQDINFYLPDITGRDGIEKYFDEALAGKGGGKLLRVDAIGYKHTDYVPLTPVPGNDIVLTLDAELQRYAETALGNKRGAALVIDLSNGDILAAATAPRFDLTKCTPRFPPEYFKELNTNPNHPLVNRAFSGRYPPGSVFKPVVALSALSHGYFDEIETINCPGYFELGKSKIKCTSSNHGHLAMREALAKSCNPYFISLGIKMGWEPHIRSDCARLGFGAAPAIGIPVNPGLLPGAEWKKLSRKESWYKGDTANISIGQGFIIATPLQIALMTSAIALDGKTIRPRLIRDNGTGARTTPEYGLPMNWSKHDLSIVKSGMHDVINKDYGTGRRLRIPGIDAAGKTGTAEYKENGKDKKHAWMICYAPADRPRYAFAVVAEESDSGGTTAAEILRPILAKTFGVSLDHPAEEHAH